MTPKIKNIGLENFKCFNSVSNIEFSKLTILTGANSSGKTSVIDAVLMILQTPQFPLSLDFNGDLIELGNFNETVFNHVTDNVIRISLSIDDVDGDDVYSVQTAWRSASKSGLAELVKLEIKSSYFSLSLREKETGSDKAILDIDYDPTKNKELSRHIERNAIARARQKYESADDSDLILSEFDRFVELNYTKRQIKGFEISNETKDKIEHQMLLHICGILHSAIYSIKENLNFIGSYRTPAQRIYTEKNISNGKIASSGEGFVQQLLTWRDNDIDKFNNVTATMQQLGLLYEIKPERIDGGHFKMSVKTTEKTPFVALSDVGFGISQLLPIIVSDAELGENSTLVVSQPEVHLHPSVQAQLANYFTSQIYSKRRNYIIETHSEYLLNRLRLLIAKGELKAGDLKVFYINREKDETGIHEIQFLKNGQIVGAPEDFFNTYMLDVMNLAIEAE